MPTTNPPKTIRFTPYCWAKFCYLRDLGETEISAIGICADPADPLLLTDLRLPKQEATVATVTLDGEAIADHLDRCTSQGLRIEQCARIWLHTHPGNSASPSGTDIDTFTETFEGAPWVAFIILARGGDLYGRVQFSAGPGGHLKFTPTVDYSTPFPASNQDQWLAEYNENVTEPPRPTVVYKNWKGSPPIGWQPLHSKDLPTEGKKKAQAQKAQKAQPTTKVLAYCVDCGHEWVETDTTYDDCGPCPDCGSLDVGCYEPDELAELDVDYLDSIGVLDQLTDPEGNIAIETATDLWDKPLHELSDDEWKALDNFDPYH